MATDPFTYEERYGWNRRSSRSLIIGFVFAVLGVALPMPLALRVIAIVFGVVVSSRKVAFRANADGVTLAEARFGTHPPRSTDGVSTTNS